MAHTYYSQRVGRSPHPKGLPLTDIIDIFVRVYGQLEDEGYFTESFGYTCVDDGFVEGNVKDVNLEILLSVRKHDLWPVKAFAPQYNEDDFFDVIEFLFQHVSKPIDGDYHNWGNCGMHWTTFNRFEGKERFREEINKVLEHYVQQFELSSHGEVLQKADAGFERIFEADLPSSNPNIVDRISASILRFRRHGSTFDDRRQAVRDLADVLEYLRPEVKKFMTSSDESDLFKIANNFGIRHHNDHQKTSYDAQLWLGWMFYFYLSTIHVLLRKIERAK